MTADDFTSFPRTLAAIDAGIGRDLHAGVQIYVSVNSAPILNSGRGQANEANSYSSATISLWRSAGKPITAALLLKLIESDDLQLSSSLADLLPRTNGTALADITLKQLLTHTSGLPMIETGWPQAGGSEILDRIYAIDTLTPGAAYQPQSSWFLLGEILSRHSTGSRNAFESLSGLLGMKSSSCGIPEKDAVRYRDDGLLPQFWTREKGQLVASPFGGAPWLTAPSPGGNLRGPVSELGLFYEMLMRRGIDKKGEPFLKPETVDLMTSRHRVGQFDQTLQHVVDFGLGLIIDSNHHGVETVPYGFGRHCSGNTFGHGGSQCAMGFCDPDRQLVVCWAANGFCGEGQHQRRNRAINEAVYEDLDLA